MTDLISIPPSRFVAKDDRTPDLYIWPCGSDWEHSFQQARNQIADALRSAKRIQRGTWQTIDVSGSDLHITRELINCTIIYKIPASIRMIENEVKPDLPWADEHFSERVGGEPLNPPPSHVNWPHHGSDAERHIKNKVFSHTYPERFWPKYAGENMDQWGGSAKIPGIRFSYGDLDDVVSQLIKNPHTRQAVLPVFFPEDTGAVENQRVPCTIAYHFMADADMHLHCWYYIRACDFVRHFHNDVYFAARLTRWICDRFIQAQNLDGSYIYIQPGNLNMTISSLHIFEGDLNKLPS